MRHLSLREIRTIVPNDTRLLLDAAAMEAFLRELEGAPPDWATVYGGGHHDPGHDDRLFQLNRDRDAARAGKLPWKERLTFAWEGNLSGFEPKTGGFSVGLGPILTPTRWGLVRFKPEDLPGNLEAIPDPQLRNTLRRRVERGEPVPITVVVTGHLIDGEAVVYDFSHDHEGLGLLMPLVTVERLDFVLVSERRER
ncbi:MAG: hypothetical protein U0172_01875 [Nitrospiraceae bacterium]